MNARAVIYLRVSSDDQARGVSLAVQERDCRAWCQANGVEVAATFTEPMSAKSDARAEFQRAVAFARSAGGAITHFVVWKLDRFSRVALDTLSYRAAIAAAGVRLVSAMESAVGSDPVGRMVTTMLAGIAEYDNEQKAERVVACMSRLSLDGWWTHRPPLGYTPARDNGRPTITPDPATAPILARAMERIADRSLTPMQALREATAAGLRTRGGKTIATSTWYDLLASPVYCGMHTTGLTGGHTIQGRWRAIVGLEVWQGVQSAVRSEKVGRKPDCVRSWPMRGFLRCPCGRTMTASASRSAAGVYAYYHCRLAGRQHVRVRIERVDGMIADALRGVSAALLPMVATVREYVRQEVDAHNRQSVEQAETARRSIASIEQRRARLMDAMLAGTVDHARFAAVDAGLRADLDAARQAESAAALSGEDLFAIVDRAESMLADLPKASNSLQPSERLAL